MHQFFSIAGSSVGPIWYKQPVARICGLEGSTSSLPVFACSTSPIYSAGSQMAPVKPYLAPCWHWGPERLSPYWSGLSRKVGLPSSKPFLEQGGKYLCV